MSWSTRTAEPITKDHAGRVGDDAIPVPSNVEPGSEADDQFRAATSFLRSLALAVGRPGDHVTIAVSGHANPGHAPASGYAEETVTITVTAVPRSEADAHTPGGVSLTDHTGAVHAMDVGVAPTTE